LGHNTLEALTDSSPSRPFPV